MAPRAPRKATRTKSPEHIALGKALRHQRERRNLTLQDLQARIKPAPLHFNYISACERGEINVSFANLLRLCEALDISLAQLIRDYESLLAQDAD